jgi:hypothetical protein
MADTEHPLTKVDSAVQGLGTSPPKEEHKKGHRRMSSTAEGVYNINDLGMFISLHIPLPSKHTYSPATEKEGKELEIHPMTQKLNWKINTSPSTLEDKEVLKKHLTTPPVKRIDLHFPLGLEVTARNLKGVTIKDALDAIYKQFRKKVSIRSYPLELILTV